MAADDRFTHHARLVSKMADRVGIDIVEEMQRGKLDAEDLRMMVHRCEGCTEPEACLELLQRGEGRTAPEYCRNTHVFESMKS